MGAERSKSHRHSSLQVNSRLFFHTALQQNKLISPRLFVLITNFVSSLLGRVGSTADCFTRGETGCEWSQWHQIAAAEADRPFLPIYLACDREENLKRVVRPQRQETSSGKLVDADMVAGFLDRLEIFKFPGGLGVDIDTTELAPEETARRILEAMKAHQEQTVQNEADT